MISVYKMEMKRVYLLADLIVQNTISDRFNPDWNPDLKAIWPSMIRKMPLTELWTLAGTNGSCSPHKVRKRATWSMEEQRWFCCTVADTVGAVSAESAH